MDSRVIYSSGDFEYRFRHDWAKLPSELSSLAACGITMDSKGFVYTGLKLGENGIIAIMDHDGQYVGKICEEYGIKSIHGIYADRDDTLWFSDVQDNYLYHTNNNGELIARFGGPDKCSNSGYNPELPWPGPLDSITHAAEPFNQPAKLVRAASGDIYVADGYCNAAMHRFDSEMNLIKTWGGAGTGAGQFRLPHSVWEDAKGRIWIADRVNNRVQVFDDDGVYIAKFEGMHAPSDIWGDARHVYVVENKGGLSIFNMELKLVASLGYASTNWNGCPLGCHSMCGDTQGTGMLYLAELKNDLPFAVLEPVRQINSKPAKR